MRVLVSRILSGLRESFLSEANAAAGQNRLMSRAEQRQLPSLDLAEAAAAYEDSGAPRPLPVDGLVDFAVDRAAAALAKVNQAAGPGRPLLSRAEVGALTEVAPALGHRVGELWDGLHLPGDTGSLAALQRALAPYVGSGGLPPLHGVAATPVSGGHAQVFGFNRTDGGVVEARVTLTPLLGQVELLMQSPAVDPEVGQALAHAIGPGLGVAPEAVAVKGYVYLPAQPPSAGERMLVAYERALGPDTAERKLVTVRFTASGAQVLPFTPSATDRMSLEDLAVRLVRSQALSLGARYDTWTKQARERGETVEGPQGPIATLEAQLRTAMLTPSQLEEQTAADSPVGFTPSVELLQLGVPSVLGDNAVFVTFDRGGGFRLEDFN